MFILIALILIALFIVIDTIFIKVYTRRMVTGIHKTFDAIKSFIFIPIVDWISNHFGDDNDNELIQ
jgi:hypothetical protein